MAIPLLAAKLVELRQSKGLSQKEVADYLGITREAYSHYERSTREPNLEVVMKLVKFYGIQVSELINDTTVPIVTISGDNGNAPVRINANENCGAAMGDAASFVGMGGAVPLISNIITRNMVHFLKLFTGKNSTVDLTNITKEDIDVLSSYKELDKQSQKEVRQFIKFKHVVTKSKE